jgi:hypothetical protein
MPISLGDILELMDALSDLHEQADARLTRPVSVHKFPIYGVLRRLGIARDLESDGVVRGRPEIVADQLDRVGSESAVAKFAAPLFYRRREQSGDGDIFANSSWHTEQVRKQPSFLLLARMLGKPFIQTLERAFAQ